MDKTFSEEIDGAYIEFEYEVLDDEIRAPRVYHAKFRDFGVPEFIDANLENYQDIIFDALSEDNKGLPVVANNEIKIKAAVRYDKMNRLHSLDIVDISAHKVLKDKVLRQGSDCRTRFAVDFYRKEYFEHILQYEKIDNELLVEFTSYYYDSCWYIRDVSIIPNCATAFLSHLRSKKINNGVIARAAGVTTRTICSWFAGDAHMSKSMLYYLRHTII